MTPAIRLTADRRAGTDRRADPRRRSFHLVSVDRREQVDRRHGAERRSTLERRGNRHRRPQGETPGEHVRNALQLLSDVRPLERLDQDAVESAVRRLEGALSMLERRTR